VTFPLLLLTNDFFTTKTAILYAAPNRTARLRRRGHLQRRRGELCWLRRSKMHGGISTVDRGRRGGYASKGSTAKCDRKGSKDSTWDGAGKNGSRHRRPFVEKDFELHRTIGEGGSDDPPRRKILDVRNGKHQGQLDRPHRHPTREQSRRGHERGGIWPGAKCPSR